jgi:hypothetical protein
MGASLDLMARDVREAPFLVAMLLLPAIVSLVPATRGSRVALIPIAVLVGQVGLWFGYYSTDWIDNPGLGGALAVASVSVGSLTIALIAAARSRSVAQPSLRTPRHGVDPDHQPG